MSDLIEASANKVLDTIKSDNWTSILIKLKHQAILDSNITHDTRTNPYNNWIISNLLPVIKAEIPYPGSLGNTRL